MTITNKAQRMRTLAITLVVILAAVILCAPAPDASDAHFVIMNNADISGNAHGTVMRLVGPMRNPSLNIATSLDTGELAGGDGGIPSEQVVRDGSDICVFMTDGIDSNGNNQISSFKYPSLMPAGNFTDANVPVGYYPYVLVASGNYLLVGFSHYISSWELASGCTLSLLQTTSVKQGSYNWAITPRGKTIVGSNGSGEVDSYSIGSNGMITENGPYLTGAAETDGIDISADSQYAIFAAHPLCSLNCFTFVAVISIDSDGSLSGEVDFGGDGSLGNAEGINNLRLSPNEKFLFASGTAQSGIENQVITLNFTENPLNVTYSGCSTTLDILLGNSGRSLVTGGTGAGEALYVGEGNEGAGNGAIALLKIDGSSGCTTEVPRSPFSVLDPNAYVPSIVSWPPRPF
jgi:hypothetical protein